MQKISVSDKLSGENYRDVLRHFHVFLRPKNYLEIGVDTGVTLNLALEGSYAVGVDPLPKINQSLRAWTKIYQMDSDEFFFTYKQENFDLVFIDGLHQFDTVCDDFVGAEKLCKETSVILFHDTIPAMQNPQWKRQ